MDTPQPVIVLKSYELLKFSISTIDNLPRKQKFIFGDRLQNLLSDFLEMLIEAYYTPKSGKISHLKACNIQIEKIRYFYRLGYELGFYSAGHFKLMVEKLNEIGRMLGAWMKSL